MTDTYPLTPLQTAVLHLERALGPWNVQLELDSRVRIDPDRLAAAVATAARHHPLASAACRPDADTPTGHVWAVPETPAVDIRLPASEGFDCDRFRSRFYGDRLDLAAGPPFRVALLRGLGVDGGDRVAFCTSHVVMDGVGTLAFVRSVCRAYRGEALDPPVPSEPTRVVGATGDDDALDRGFRVVEAARQVAQAVSDPPTRLASDGESPERAPTADHEWGFHHRTLSPGLAERLVENRPPDVTVNDVLLAALHLAAEDWNDNHGTPSGRVSLLVPVNARPESWFYDGVGMHTSFLSVSTSQAERTTPERALRAVGRRVERFRRHDGAAWVGDALSTLGPALAPAARHVLPRLVARFDDRLLDTAVLSNLGRVPAFEGFDPGGPAALRASPPARLPMGVAFAITTLRGRVGLGLRYSRRQFDTDAAVRFTDRFLGRVADFV